MRPLFNFIRVGRACGLCLALAVARGGSIAPLAKGAPVSSTYR